MAGVALPRTARTHVQIRRDVCFEEFFQSISHEFVLPPERWIHGDVRVEKGRTHRERVEVEGST